MSFIWCIVGTSGERHAELRDIWRHVPDGRASIIMMYFVARHDTQGLWRGGKVFNERVSDGEVDGTNTTRVLHDF